MRVETLCEGQWLASSTFCELPVGKRVAICMLLFTAVMLSDLVLALRVATSARSSRPARVAAPRAIGAFALAAFHDAVADAAVKAKAEASGSGRGKPPPPKARKASAARPRAPKAKAEPAAKPADSEKLDVVLEVVPAEPAGVSYVSPCVEIKYSTRLQSGARPAVDVRRVGRARERAGARQQFLRTDAALDLAVGAALRHADTVRVAGARSGDTDLSPSRTASLLYGAVDAGAAGLVGGAARWSAPAPFVSLARDGCRRKACARLAALLRHREATERRAGDAAAPDDHLVADAYSALNENLLTVARDAAVELMRAGLRAQHLAPSLVASVALAAYKEHAAVERGLESSLQSFLALAPKRFVSAYARHALDLRPRGRPARGVLADDEDDADHAEYFALQSCRIDSLQAMMDDLQAAILADALASQRAALWRLLYLGAPLVGVLLAGAYLGLLGLVAFVRYQESVAERLDRLRSAERKYKKLLTTWVPLKERIAGAAPPNEAA
ncbi:hypothetical protein JL720_12969 [Aureococcus anophagefferens]|nr:hypothetical protein JL720_12969 [Aureococcus anophagefferens]